MWILLILQAALAQDTIRIAEPAVRGKFFSFRKKFIDWTMNHPYIKYHVKMLEIVEVVHRFEAFTGSTWNSWISAYQWLILSMTYCILFETRTSIDDNKNKTPYV